MVTNLDDGDYFLKDGSGWFEYGPLVVRLLAMPNNEGMEITVYRNGYEAEDPVFQTFVGNQ
jgi:hypothetical protein